MATVQTDFLTLCPGKIGLEMKIEREEGREIICHLTPTI